MQPGDLVKGKYRIVRELGAGGHAVVYLARQDDIRREVALKVLPKSDDAGYDVAIARFKREAKIIATLQNQHTVSLLDYGQTDDGAYFMAFELLSGNDLEAVIAQRGPLDEDTVFYIAEQLLASLQEAHNAGIIHRDLKPANIMLAPRPDDPWFVKLIDFGIAVPTQLSPEAGLTKTGFVVGTVRFMAPEQMYGAKVTPASDLFTLGLVLVELLLGPRGMDRPAIASMDLPKLPCSAHRQAVVHRLLQVSPNLRFRTAEEVLAALRDDPEQLQRTAALLAPPMHPSMMPTEPIDIPMRPPRVVEEEPEPRPFPLGVVALVLGLLISVGIAGVMLRSSKDEVVPAEPAEPRINQALLRTGAAAPRVEEPSSDEPNEATVAPDAGSGCSVENGTWMIEETLDGQQRSWVLHVPPTTYDGVRPLVVFFHGASLAPEDYLRGGLEEFARETGFAIAAPFGEETFAWPLKPGSMTWVSELVAATAERACVDPEHVLVWGDDTGGFVTMPLACEPWVAAIATSSFLPYVVGTDQCESPIKPYLNISPTGSQHIPIDGNHKCPAGAPHLPLKAQLDYWSGQNGCAGRASSRRVGAATCDTWTCAVPLESCIAPGGQQWPRMSPRVFDIFGCDGGPLQIEPKDLVGPFFTSQIATLREPDEK